MIPYVSFFVYLLECADKTLYAGSTPNLEKRLHQHNNLKSGARYTKARRPVKLVYSEELPSWSDALKREWAIKQLSREEKLGLIRIAKKTSKLSKILRGPIKRRVN